MTNAPSTTQTFLSGVSMTAVPTAKGIRIDMVLPGTGRRRLCVSLRGVRHGQGHRLTFTAGWDGAMETATIPEGLLAFGYDPLPVPVPPSRGLGELRVRRPGNVYVPPIRVAPGTRDLIGLALIEHLGHIPSSETLSNVRNLVRLAAMAMDPALRGMAGKKALATLRFSARKGGWRPD